MLNINELKKIKEMNRSLFFHLRKAMFKHAWNGGFCKISNLINFAQFAGKYLRWSPLSNKNDSKARILLWFSQNSSKHQADL